MLTVAGGSGQTVCACGTLGQQLAPRIRSPSSPSGSASRSAGSLRGSTCREGPPVLMTDFIESGEAGVTTLESPPFLSGGGLSLSATPGSDPIASQSAPEHYRIGSYPGAQQPETEPPDGRVRRPGAPRATQVPLCVRLVRHPGGTRRMGCGDPRDTAIPRVAAAHSALPTRVAATFWVTLRWGAPVPSSVLRDLRCVHAADLGRCHTIPHGVRPRRDLVARGVEHKELQHISIDASPRVVVRMKSQTRARRYHGLRRPHAPRRFHEMRRLRR